MTKILVLRKLTQEQIDAKQNAVRRAEIAARLKDQTLMNKIYRLRLAAGRF